MKFIRRLFARRPFSWLVKRKAETDWSAEPVGKVTKIVCNDETNDITVVFHAPEGQSWIPLKGGFGTGRTDTKK